MGLVALQHMGSSRIRDGICSLSCIGKWILYHHQGSPSEYLKVKVKVALSCLTLCDSMDYTVHGILQARILEWVAIPFSGGISLIQGYNSGLLHYRQILYQLSHKLNIYYEADRRWEREQGHCFDEIFILMQRDKVKKDKRMDEVGKEGRKRRREVKRREERGTGSTNSLWLVLDGSYDTE